jgi:hypothetical protein
MILLSLLFVAIATPLNEFTNTAVLSDQPDSLCLQADKKTVLPLSGQGAWLDIDLHTSGPENQGPRALDVLIRYENNSTNESYSWLGQQLAPFLVTGEDTQSIQLGERPNGPIFGQRWRIATGRPEAPIRQLEFKSLLQNHRICVTNVRLHSDAPLPLGTDTQDWYTFVAQTGSDPVPQAQPVRGPANRRVQRKEDGHLYFEDGQRARFWGVNLTGDSAIPSKEDANALAAHLARLGFNAVRFHHIDGNEAGLVNAQRHKSGEPDLFPERLDDLDFFVSRLKAHGIYLFLEIATARELGPKDGLPRHGHLPNGHKLASMFRPVYTKAYLQTFENLWGRENPYTHSTYAQEPAVALLNLSNEHSLLSSWGGALEGLGREHLRILDARWNKWLKKQYESNAALNKAWVGSSHARLQPGEDLERGTVRRLPLHPGLRYAFPRQRLMDLNRFYADLELSFYQQVSAKADEMGFSQPRSASMSFGRAQNQHLYSSWDAADLHLEWDQTRARRTLSNLSALQHPREHRLLESAAFAVHGQAFVVTELNHPFPNQFMAEAPLLWATLASIQDWDALIWLDWKPSVPEELDGFVHSQFDLAYATVKSAQMPSASSLFRSGDLEPANGFFPLYRGEVTARMQSIVSKTPLPWQTQDIGFWVSHQIRSVLQDEILPERPGDPPQGVDWNVESGHLRLDQRHIQAIIGPPKDQRTSRLHTNLNEWAAVSIASGDGRPLTEAQTALITIGTQQENTGMAWDLQHTVIRSWGGRPILIQPLSGTIRFAWKGRPIVEVLDDMAQPKSKLKVKRSGRGWWSIQLDETVKSPWITIRSP